MLLDLLRGNTSVLIPVILSLPIILFSLTFHEFSHAWVAHKMGDDTARNFGRLTLNPLAHLDPIGTICMLLFGFGWAKPVPINTRNFKNPKKGMALSSLAGPLSNIFLGFVGILLMRIMFALLSPIYVSGTVAGNIIQYTVNFFYLFGYLNISLAVFNMLPIPPFDGSRIIWIFLPDKYYFGIMKYERYIQIALLLLLYTGILTWPLSKATYFIYHSFDSLIGLIPFL